MAKYRFQVLVGRHIEGLAYRDQETEGYRLATCEEADAYGKLRAGSASEAESVIAASIVPAVYYKGGPLGDVIETDRNLGRFNSVGSTKFKLLALGEELVPEINDGLEGLTVRELRAYAKENSIEFSGSPENMRKEDLLKEIRAALVGAH